MPTPPPLDTERRRQAYTASLELRRRRAKLKQLLSEFADREAAVRFLATMWQREPDTQGMKVIDLLRALPGIGPKAARQIMLAAGIAPERVDKKTVRSTGPKQTEALFAELRKRI